MIPPDYTFLNQESIKRMLRTFFSHWDKEHFIGSVEKTSNPNTTYGSAENNKVIIMQTLDIQVQELTNKAQKTCG